MSTKSMSTDLDPIDVQLLALLQRDGRMSNADLAERVGLSPSTCLRRVQRLEQDQLILGYRADLPAAGLGLGLRAFISVQMTHNDTETLTRFAEDLASWDEVVACYSITGDYDYLVHILVENLESYSRFMLQRMLVNRAVRHANTSIVVEMVKPNRGIPLGHLSR